MRIASVADVKAHFGGYLEASKEGPVVVTRDGKPVAVLLSIVDEEEIERLVLAHSPKFQGLLDVARCEIQEGQALSHDEFWRGMA